MSLELTAEGQLKHDSGGIAGIEVPPLRLHVGLRRSAGITEIAKALSAAQAEMGAPKKTRMATVRMKDGGSYSYVYADLAAVKDAYRGPCGKYGLSVIHSVAPVDGHLLLTTTILHTGGQWYASDYPIPTYDKPQEQGSALTYYKRYNVCALLDIVAEDDDDGTTAQQAEPKQREESTNPNAMAITDLALEIQLIQGGTVEEIIRKASFFQSDDGRPHSFTDPKDVTSPKWLANTRRRLSDELTKLRVKSEPGAAEGAEIFGT